MKTSKVKWTLLLSLAFAGCATPPQKAPSVKEPAFPLSWVEMGPNSSVLARTITRDQSCPSIQLNGTSKEMTLRSASSAEFPVTVCEANIPPSTQAAEILGKSLILPKQNPNRILVIGDTGCRVKTGKWGQDIQDCNDPNAWPFEKIAQVTAAWKPELVIHVGDYLYRESICPPGEPKCASSPVGDNWASWTADFFTPGESLITTAPWIFVRGNHELCSRGGQGWSRFLDPSPYNPTCSDKTPPYWVKAGNSQFIILDSALADDQHPKEDQVQMFTEQFKTIQKFPITQGLLLTHKPFWAVAENDSDQKTSFTFLNKTLQTSSNQLLSKNIQAVIAGHIHAFQVLQFKDSGPVQIVAGNSGTKLSPVSSIPPLSGKKIGERTIQQGFTLPGYGYMTLEKLKDNSWKIQEHDIQGSPQKTCTLKKTKLNCQAQK